MIYVAFMCVVVATLAAGAYLVVNGHPGFALLVLLMGGSVSMKGKDHP